MPTFGIVENNVIVNIIVAESLEAAKSVVGENIIEQEDSEQFGVGFYYENGNWIAPQPYPSWIRDGLKWKAPIEYPDNGLYEWDENSESWVKMI